MKTDTFEARQLSRYDKLKSERVNWEQIWQDSLKFTMPHRAFITRQRSNEGERIDEDIFDSTARRSNQILAAGFHGNLTNPSQRWFRLRLQELELNEIEEVKLWLSDSDNKILDILNASNFNQQINQMYLDLGSVGTSVLYCAEDIKEIVRFQSRQIEEIMIDEDADERVTTVMRKYKLSARQAYDEFGENVGPKVKEFIEKGKWDEKIEYLHCVTPREYRDHTSNLSTNMPIASFHIDAARRKIVLEGGYHEMPYMVTRFYKVSGDKYGYSPASIMLPDIKMLNKVTETIIKAAEKMVDPALVLPSDSFILPLKTIPGGINYKTAGDPREKIEVLGTQGNIPVGRDMQNDLRTQIQQGFFTDLFMMLQDRNNMTATEVSERVAEKMVLLGPVLGRLQAEMLNPVIDRVFGIALRRGILLPPPPVLAEREILVEYVSPLALAQKRDSVTGISTLLQFVGGMAQFNPEVLDKIDTDQVVDEVSTVLGVSPKIVLDDESVARIREQRANQQALVQAAQAAGAVTDIAKKDSEAAKNYAMAGKESDDRA